MADHSDKVTEERRQRNADILAPLDDSVANGRFFARCAAERAELKRKITVIIRQIMSKKKADKTELELLMDDWCFNNGPADTPAKQRIMFKDIIARRIAQLALQRQQRDKAEYRALSGLMDGFEDSGLSDFPL
jgi:hypothetical protein